VNNMTIFLTGSKGVLGKQLKKVFPDSLSPSHKELDVGERDDIFRYFQKHSDITTIIHAAALTSVRPCEDNKLEAWKSNVNGTKNLVDAAFKINPEIYFIYISTACVFQGTKGMYNEKDLPYPKNFYAFTKYIGETKITTLNQLIIRTNFVGNEPWRYPKAFADRFGTYLFAEGVAKGVKDVIDANLKGIVHIVGDKKISMYELAKMTSPNVKPMSLDEYEGPPVTVDMSLDTIRWHKYNINTNV